MLSLSTILISPIDCSVRITHENYVVCLTLSWPISMHSHKPPVDRIVLSQSHVMCIWSFQPQNIHMCKQFFGKVSTAKMFFENQTYLWFVWFFLQNENELKIEEIFLPWKAKLWDGKDCSSIARTRWRAAAASQLHRRTRYRAAAASHTLATRSEHILRDVTSDQYFAEIFNTTHLQYHTSSERALYTLSNDTTLRHERA